MSTPEERKAQRRASDARRRARMRGEDVPLRRPGPPKGSRLSAEECAKRSIRVRGPKNPSWRGDEASVHAGRLRAQRLYPNIGPCSRCQNPKAERHHKDGNTHNNDPENIEALCRRCHMEADGRIGS